MFTKYNKNEEGEGTLSRRERRNRKKQQAIRSSENAHYELYKISNSHISYHVSIYVSPFVVDSIVSDDIYVYTNSVTYKAFDFLEDEISQYIKDTEHTHIMQLNFDTVCAVLLLRNCEFILMILSDADFSILQDAISQNKNRIDFGWALFIISDYLFLIN